MGRGSWMVPTRRVTEATPQARAAAGAIPGLVGGWDTLDGDYGFRPAGSHAGGAELPARTRDQARADSITGYRANPLARAIIDTYVAFMVGDAGLTLQCSSDDVRPYAEAFWTDPKNSLATGQELMARSALLNGEVLNEMMVGQRSGVTRRSPIDPARIKEIRLLDGNPLWPEAVVLRGAPGEPDPELSVVDVDDLSGLLAGEAMFWPLFRSLETDRRGAPFLMPILDWLDSYDAVLSNLVDRTAVARFIAWQVQLSGTDANVDEFIRKRGGNHAPRSGTIEVTTDTVDWKPIYAQTGSFEDVNTNQSIMTGIAAGTGLSKPWLAEPEDANRATSITMAEPVRRRVGSVQNVWVALQTHMVRYAVDRLVAAGTIPRMVTVPGAAGPVEVPAASTVSITGPQVAAADAQMVAQVLMNLGQGLTALTQADILSTGAAQELARKAWTDFMGVPYRPELDGPDVDRDDVATAVEDAGGGAPLLEQLQPAA